MSFKDALLRIGLCAAVACVPWACEEADIEPDAGPMPLVVEGWIEEGQSPMVILTRAVDLSQPSPSFDDFVEKWARVSVFDGDTRYVLTGRIDHRYTPPFVYTSARLKGKVGHTYRLLVETETDTLEAVATMLPAPDLLPLEAVHAEGQPDSLYAIRARIDGTVPDDGLYKFFSRAQPEERRFYGSFMGTFRGSDYNPETGMTITRGIHSLYSDEDFSHFYTAGTRVSVKICSLEPALYDFWHTYDNSVSLSQNLFFTFAGNCPSNVDGALGYWAAYGSSTRTIVVK